MTNSNFLKKLLTTASVVAVSASAGNAFAGANIDRNATIGNGGAPSVGISAEGAPGVDIVHNNGTSLKRTVANTTMTTREAITLGQLDLNNLAAGLFTVAHDTTLGGSVINAGAQKQNVTVNDGIALTTTATNLSALGAITLGSGVNGATLNINAATELGGAITTHANNKSTINVDADVVFANTIGTNAAKVGTLDVKNNRTATLQKDAYAQNIQIGNGSTTVVADGVKIGSDNIKGTAADQGTLRFAGASEVSATKIGDGTKLNIVELAGKGIVNFKATTDFDATTTLLNHADAVLQFSTANTTTTNIKTATNSTGKTIISEGMTLNGQIGEDGKSLAEVNFGADKTLILKKDASKLYADNVTAGAGTGEIDIQSGDFEIHSNIGAEGAALKAVKITSNEAGAAATNVKLMAGRAIHAGQVDLSAGNFDNILELHEGSSITGNVTAGNANKGSLSVQGDATITGTIGAVGNAIDTIKFDAEKTLTVSKNVITTANGINFAKDGILELTEDAAFTIDKAVTTAVAEGGTGSIIANKVGSGKEIEITAQVGDINAANNALKLLQARGGANIKLSSANTNIKKIDIEGVDSTLILNSAGSEFLIGNFSHSDGQGTLQLAENATLKEGTNLSTAQNTLKAVDLGANKTLTVQDGVDIYTSAGADGGIRTSVQGNGILAFEGNSTVGGIVGSNIEIGAINVQGKGKTTIFLNEVKLSAAGNGTGILTIGEDATAELRSNFTGVDISGANANEGTIRFNNSEALVDAKKVKNTIGAAQRLNTVEIANKNVTFENAKFNTGNLKFTGSDASVVFDAIAGVAGVNSLQNTTITTNSTTRKNNIVISTNDDFTFDKSVGTAENQLGYIKLAEDKTVTVNSADFYADVRNAVNQKGEVVYNNNGTALGFGSATAELETATINGNRTFKESVWAKDITVNNNTTFEKSVNSSNQLLLANGSVANFTGENADLNAKIAAAAGQGTVNFSNSININRTIGASGAAVRAINFNGAANRVASLNTDIHANNIVVGAQTVKANENVTLGGATTFNGSTVDLETNTVTLTNGASSITGEATINLALNNQDTIGHIVVDGAAASLNANAATKLAINIADNEADLPTADETYTLFVDSNNAKITALTAGKETVTSTGNNFVDWSLAGNDLVRKNVAEKKLNEILGSNSNLLADALILVDTDNTGNAAAFASDLAKMDTSKVKDAVARVTEQTSIHANELSSQLMDTANATINNRMGALSNHPQAGIQLASDGTSGIAAGEGDHTMYGVWASPFYNQTTQKARGGRSGYKANTYGVTLGFDTQANADLTVGVAGTYAKADVKMKDQKSGDKIKSDSFMFSIYGIQQLTDNWFLQGHAAYETSRMKNSEKRNTALVSEIAKSSHDVTSYNTEILGGYSYNYAGANVTPLIGASYTRINSSGYTETGTTNQNLTVKTKATNKFEAVAGVRAQMETEANGIHLTPEMHGFVRHDFIAKDAKVSAKLSGAAKSLTPKSAKAIKTTYNVGVGVNAVSGMYEYGVGYDLFAADKTLGHQGTLKVRVNF